MDGHAEEKMHVCHVCGKFSSKRFKLIFTWKNYDLKFVHSINIVLNLFFRKTISIQDFSGSSFELPFG